MTYTTMAEAYLAEMPRLLSVARSRLINTDYAIDCVHDAFEKVLEYQQTHAKSKISGFLLLRETNRAVKRYNKRTGIELSFNEDSNT